MDRRNFLSASGAASALYSVLPSRVLGANDRIRVAVLGCGSIAGADVPAFQQHPSAQIVALCDVYQERIGQLKERTGLTGVREFEDWRRMLDLPDIDVLLNCTPDHWHAIPMITACNRGLDVYVEKPLAHNIAEGRAMVTAARKNNRIVQMGTQQRSGYVFQRAVQIVHAGLLGEISMVRCWNMLNRYPRNMGHPPDSDPPAGMNWDLWLGPAPKRPYNQNYYRNFRQFYDYAGGMMTDWFTHWVDIVQWAMQVRYPHTVTVIGNKYHTDSMRETPDAAEAILEYDSFFCTYSYSILNDRGFYNDEDMGILFCGSDASLYLNRHALYVVPQTERRDGKRIPRTDPITIDTNGAEQRQQRVNHAANFLDCVRSRQRPVSDVEIGHYSTVASHLANVALRAGARIEYDGVAERVTNVEDTNRFLKREYRAPWKLPV